MNFSYSKIAVAAGLATGALFSSFATGNAFAFGFEFQGTYSQNDAPTGDILLESVTIGEDIIEDFSFVTSATIVNNDAFSGGNSGAASADTGDNATGGVRQEDAEAEDVVANLATNNLNHIVDTEDTGSFEIDLNFGKSLDNLLIWERGMNSDLGIQAVDAAGNLIGNRLVVTRDMWYDAGFAIDTSEIDGAQDVGAIGINIFSDLGIENGAVETIRFFSESSFNGPDWKFVGTDAARDVPEPALLMSLGLFGGALALQKRLKAA
ncbi:MAG: exosortase-dependent surface protein XDP2 [Cyanobacteria bacterium P01_D01_bin.71]